MYPVLFEWGGFRLDAYNVMWLIALSMAVWWSTERFALYNVDDGEARRVFCWSFLAMMLGAAVFKSYLRLVRLRVWDFQHVYGVISRGGLSEMGAVLGAFLTAFALCFRNRRVSFQALCEVAAIPAFLAIAVGRWGCFFNGCCFGTITDSVFAVHFPFDRAGVTRHPTQLYYSAVAALCVVFLLWLERRRRPTPDHAVIAPTALILYGLMRLAIDPMRYGNVASGTSHWILYVAMPLEVLWLAHSLWVTGKAWGFHPHSPARGRPLDPGMGAER